MSHYKVVQRNAQPVRSRSLLRRSRAQQQHQDAREEGALESATHAVTAGTTAGAKQPGMLTTAGAGQAGRSAQQPSLALLGAASSSPPGPAAWLRALRSGLGRARLAKALLVVGPLLLAASAMAMAGMRGGAMVPPPSLQQEGAGGGGAKLGSAAAGAGAMHAVHGSQAHRGRPVVQPHGASEAVVSAPAAGMWGKLPSAFGWTPTPRGRGSSRPRYVAVAAAAQQDGHSTSASGSPGLPPQQHAAGGVADDGSSREWRAGTEARVLCVVPRGSRWPGGSVYTTTWDGLAAHTAQRLAWTDEAFQMMVFHAEDIGHAGEAALRTASHLPQVLCTAFPAGLGG